MLLHASTTLLAKDTAAEALRVALASAPDVLVWLPKGITRSEHEEKNQKETPLHEKISLRLCSSVSKPQPNAKRKTAFPRRSLQF